MKDSDQEDEKNNENQTKSIKQKILDRFFEIYYKIMQERTLGTPFTIILIIIATLQLFGFVFYEKANYPFDDPFYSYLCSLFDYLRIFPAVQISINSGLYLSLMFIFFAYSAIYLIQLVYVDFSIKAGNFYFIFPLRFLTILSSLYWILLIPGVEFFISIFNCQNGVHTILNSQCFQGIHIFYCIFFVFSLIIYVAIAIGVSLFFNESRSNSYDGMARLDMQLEFQLFIYMAILACIAQYITSNGLQWIMIVLQILGSLYFMICYFRYIPFYSPVVSTIYGICVTSYFWVCLNLLLTQILVDMDYKGQTIIIIAGIIIIIFLVKSLREKLLYNLLFETKWDKIKKEYDLDLYVKALTDLIQNSSQNDFDEMLLLGFVNNHKSDCQNPLCPLNTNDELYLPLTGTYALKDRSNLKDPVLLKHLICAIFEEYCKKSGMSSILHIIYSQFLFNHMGNNHMALLELFTAEKSENSIQQQFNVYRSKRLIENYLNEKAHNIKESNEKSGIAKMDVTIVIQFEALFTKLSKSIEVSANEHIEFWSHLESLMPDLNVVNKQGLGIIDCTKQTYDLWSKVNRINPNYSKALNLYGSYLSEIKSDLEAGEELLARARANQGSKNNERLNDFEIMFAEDTAIIVMSGNKETQSKITKTNSGITKLFGYSTFEVTGHDVTILMPPLLSSMHQTFLDKYFKKGKDKILNHETPLFALNRAGFLFDILLMVKQVPSLMQKIQYIGLLRPINKNYEFILND